MKLEKMEMEIPTIIFEKRIDKDDVENILNIFKNWCEEEYKKRECKLGKLFEVSICNKENHFSLYFGNKSKYMDVSNGFMIGDVLENDKYIKLYKEICEEAIKYLQYFAKEKKLKLEIIPSEGLANFYKISKTMEHVCV